MGSAQLSLSDILKGFARVGYRAYPFQTHQQEALYAKEVRSYMFRMALAGLGSMQVMMCAVAPTWTSSSAWKRSS